MTIFRSREVEFRPADPQSFAGAARTRLLASSEDGVPAHVYHVQFEDGARTNWHTHSNPQWLFVVEGRIRIQVWGQAAHEAETGDAIVIPPGEKHWHGSVAGGSGAHLAVNINAQTTWLEPVSDGDYRGRD
jgi:quercetin dioxygenase-like cupin family protein